MDAESATRWRSMAAVARGQHGLVTIEQLRDCGIGKGSIEKAVRAGRLHRLHAGIYAVGHTAPRREARWLAAVLACGPGASLSHYGAATLHRIRDGERWRVDVTSPSGSGRRREGIIVHRSPLEGPDRAMRLGIPVTSVSRTIADMAHELDDDAMTRMLGEAQYLKVFHLASVELAQRRRPSRRLGALLEDLAPTESPLEDAFLKHVVRRHGLPLPICQPKVEGFRVDFHWPDARLVVEVDGKQHADPARMQADHVRDNILHLAGQLVLRYTFADVRRRHARVAAQIAGALRDRGT